MFGLGASEIFILITIGLVFVGPKQIPDLMRSLGKFARELTKAKNEFKASIDSDESLRGIKRSIESVKAHVDDRVRQVKSAIQRDLESLDTEKTEILSPDERSQIDKKDT